MIATAEIRHFHLFCGLGGGAAGFNRGQARVGNTRAAFRCIGGVDVDPASIRDFDRLAGVPGTVLDLFDRDQYRAFHGREPGPDWREASVADIHRAAGGERPHIVFLSAPCKGFSGLLAEKQSGTAKYQALNGLTLRGVWLMLESWKDDPPELIVFENVPRIMTRGRKLLDAIMALLRSYGYSVAETTHDCGKLGGLAQSRKRFLLVARHRAKVPPFLYEPMSLPLRGVGEVLGLLPLPGDIAAAGPMHRVPSLQWRTWVRLAFVEAGKDWRSLNRLRVGEDGNLLDFGVAPTWQAGVLGVNRWDEPVGVIPARSSPTNGAFSVADPRGGDASDEIGSLPAADTRLVCRITALDGTWHRPFTTLELAALQSLFDPGEAFILDGVSDSGWRERIGNAVPRDAAAAIASTMGRTLLMAWSGTGFMLSSEPIWVRPIAMALAVETPELAA